MNDVVVLESKMVMRGKPLPAPMDEWTGCREPAYLNGVGASLLLLYGIIEKNMGGRLIGIIRYILYM